MTLDHEALVQHLCTPPYLEHPFSQVERETVTDPPSCRTIVTELRQKLHDNSAMLELIATFEEVAMRLDVYE